VPHIRPDIIVFGSSPWDQPWLTEHNVAHALRVSANVLFVDPPRSPIMPLRDGVRLETVRSALACLRPSLDSRDGISLGRPTALPWPTKRRSQQLSASLLRVQVDQWVRRLNFVCPTVVTARPLFRGEAPAERQALVYLVKDWLQSGADMLGLDPGRLRADEYRSWSEADHILATSEALRARLEQTGFPSTVMRHGFDSGVATLYESDAPPPPDWACLPRPWLCYAGRVDGRLDFEALRVVADRWAGGTLILLGPISPRLAPSALAALRARSNVRFFPRVQREDLPARLKHCDCLLMPYEDSEWLLYGSPLKLWDYLYAGPPIAGSGCTALVEYPPPLVYFSLRPSGLANAVASALAAGRSHAHLRRTYATENTWEHRAQQVLAFAG